LRRTAPRYDLSQLEDVDSRAVFAPIVFFPNALDGTKQGNVFAPPMVGRTRRSVAIRAGGERIGLDYLAEAFLARFFLAAFFLPAASFLAAFLTALAA